ncbi:hypothetical protein EV699_1431, partial [Plasticicumulans lactativorans]
MSLQRTLCLATALLLAAYVGPLQAAVIDDPASGGESFFAWEDAGSLTGVFDVGPDDGISDEPGAAGWFLSLPSPHRIGIAVATYNRPPTTFTLLIDGNSVPWTHAQITPEVISEDNGIPLEVIHHFNGTLSGGILGAGLHFITFTASAPNTDGNAGHIRFLPAIAIAEPPLPACIALAAAALVAGLRREPRSSPPASLPCIFEMTIVECSLCAWTRGGPSLVHAPACGG